MKKRTGAFALVPLGALVAFLAWRAAVSETAPTPPSLGSRDSPSAPFAVPSKPRDADVEAARAALPQERREPIGRSAPTQPELRGEVFSLRGPRVPGARIRLLDDEGTPILETQTDEQGRFVLTAPSPEPVSLVVEAEGYASVRRRAAPGREPVTIVLAPRARYRVLVMDAQTRRPLSGARLVLREEGEEDATARTGPDGFAVVWSSGLGGRLVATHPGYERRTTVLPSLDAGEERRVDLALRPVDALAVLVADENGDPVSDPHFLGAEDARWWDARPLEGERLSGDAPGVWRVPRVPWLRVSAEGRADAFLSLGWGPETKERLEVTLRPGCEVSGLVLSEEGDEPALVAVWDPMGRRTPWMKRTGPEGAFTFAGLERAHDYDPVVSRGDTRRIVSFRTPDAAVYRLPPIETVPEGVLSVRGRVLDTASLPIAGAKVRLRSVWHPLPDAVQETTTDEAGRFAVSACRSPFLSELRVSAEGFCPRTFRILGHRPQPANVILSRAEAFRGRVVDERGEAVPFARVRARPSLALGSSHDENPTEGLQPDEYAQAVETTADADGRFTIPLCAESVLLKASKPGYITLAASSRSVSPGQEVVLTLTRIAGLRVRALRPDGRPPDRPWTLRYAPLGQMWGGTAFRVLTLPASADSFDAALPAGLVGLSLSAVGCVPRSRTLRLEAGRTTEFTYVLEDAYPVRLRLAAPDGGDFAGAEAFVRPIEGDPLAPPLLQARVEASGTLALDLAAGRYVVTVFGHGRAEFAVTGPGEVSAVLVPCGDR